MLSTDIKHSKSTVLAAATTPVRTDGPLTVEDALALGRALNAELAGHRIPPFCVESSFSLLRGLHKPGIWGALCRGLFENRPCSYWSAIIDHGDLLAMPQALERWGGERLAIGAYVDLPASAVSGSDCCTFLTPNRQAYGQLCELLSWRHEQPQAWSSFIAGGTCPIPCHHLIVLCRTSHWLRRFFACGCEVYMQAGVRPATLPADLHDCDIRIAALPRFRALRRIDHNLLPLLHAIRNGTTCSIRHRDRRPILEHDLTFALPRLGQYFAGFEEQLQCGCELLERCTLFKHHDPDKPKWHVPPAPIHEGDADHRLRQLAEAGIPDRYGDQEPPEVFERLNMECEVIRDTRFAGYILTVYDLAKNRTTCGRGSGASSLICYLLGITNVDPIRYQLVFERFLTRERRDPPDIDIDFPWDERDEVIAKALTRYGQGKAAMVVTHQTMSRKAALREVARAHGLDDGSISSVRDQLRNHHRFGSELHLPEPWPDLLPLARLLTKLPRHCGLHCGGVVITNKPIRHIVPIHPAAKHIKGQPVPALAWEKDGTEQMGLIKIDLLGNRSLAVIRDCLQDLEEDGIRVPRQQWLHPDTDSKTRDLVATGKTMGCFYIESPATRQLQQKAASGDFDRLVVHSSIIRPAAMRYIDRYLERLHEHRRTGVIQEEWFLHPALMNLLSESYGVMSYQEDVMLVCKRLAGFNDQQANKVRKVLGSWGEESEERMAPLRALFYAGCRKRDDIDEETINAIWEMIESFTGYSFCKAHSASYAMVSFQCAFLKAHYPAYFLARVITNEGGFYNASAYCEEARRLGITLLPPLRQRKPNRQSSKRCQSHPTRAATHSWPGQRCHPSHKRSAQAAPLSLTQRSSSSCWPGATTATNPPRCRCR